MVILVFCVGSTLPLPVFVVLSGNAVFCRRSGTVAIYKSGVGCSALLSMAPLPVLGVRWPRGRVGVGRPPRGDPGGKGDKGCQMLGEGTMGSPLHYVYIVQLVALY